jgi:hypothetical protein
MTLFLKKAVSFNRVKNEQRDWRQDDTSSFAKEGLDYGAHAMLDGLACLREGLKPEF